MAEPKDKAYIWRSRRDDGTHEWVVQWPRAQRYPA